MTGTWLPEGFHYGLHIEHHPLEDAGPFTGGGNKWEWHTTESPWDSVDAMVGVLAGKRAASHLVIGGRLRVKHPVVVQLVPFNRSARALANDSSDGFATNRADAIQTEICWRAALSAQLTDWHYQALANLVRLTNITVPHNRVVPRRLARSFRNTQRFSDREFVEVSGHLGHMHTPDNDHTDPGTGFKGTTLMRRLSRMPAHGYKL